MCRIYNIKSEYYKLYIHRSISGLEHSSGEGKAWNG